MNKITGLALGIVATAALYNINPILAVFVACALFFALGWEIAKTKSA